MIEVSAPNNLKQVRLSEGLSISELSRSCGVSDKTISDVENCRRTPATRTLHKILNGLNNRPGATNKFTFEEIFPNYEAV